MYEKGVIDISMQAPDGRIFGYIFLQTLSNMTASLYTNSFTLAFVQSRRGHFMVHTSGFLYIFQPHASLRLVWTCSVGHKWTVWVTMRRSKRALLSMPDVNRSPQAEIPSDAVIIAGIVL